MEKTVIQAHASGGHKWAPGDCAGSAETVSGLRYGSGRKRRGSTTDLCCAHLRATLSEEKIRIRPYMERNRGRVRSARVTAHLFVGVTNCVDSHFTSLPQTFRTGPSVDGLRCDGPRRKGVG